MIQVFYRFSTWLPWAIRHTSQLLVPHYIAHVYRHSLSHYGFCLATVARPHTPWFSFLRLRQGQSLCPSSATVPKVTARQYPWCGNECQWGKRGTRLHSPVESTSSTYEQKLECWVTVVERFVFQYVTWIESYKPVKLHFNLWSLCI
jgi:hypothetical protein